MKLTNTDYTFSDLSRVELKMLSIMLLLWMETQRSEGATSDYRSSEASTNALAAVLTRIDVILGRN